MKSVLAGLLCLTAAGTAATAHAQMERRAAIVENIADSIAKITTVIGDGKGEIGTGFVFDPQYLYTPPPQRHHVEACSLATEFYNHDPATQARCKQLFEEQLQEQQHRDKLPVFIATNQHVACPDGKPGLEFRVQFQRKTALSHGKRQMTTPKLGKLLGCDEFADLAVIMITGDEIPPLQFAREDELHVGDSVFAIGYAFNFQGQPSVTAGSLSDLDRMIADGRFAGLLQTDATINHGNSGGPLINMNGHVVGINTYSSDPMHGGAYNVYYARSSITAAPFLRMLAEHGHVIRANLGVASVKTVAPIATSLRLGQGGVMVDGFQTDSPAEKAGLKIGDVIYQMGVCDQKATIDLLCQRTPVRSFGELMNLLGFIAPGSKVSLVIVPAKTVDTPHEDSREITVTTESSLND